MDRDPITQMTYWDGLGRIWPHLFYSVPQLPQQQAYKKISMELNSDVPYHKITNLYWADAPVHMKHDGWNDAVFKKI